MDPEHTTTERAGSSTGDRGRADASPSARDGGGLGALAWLVIALAFVFYSAFFAWFPALRTPNELTRVYLASALVEDHTVRIDAQIARHGKIFDIAVREVDGQRHYFSDKAPGVALLATPFLAAYEAVVDTPTLEGQVRITRFVASTLPTLLLLVLLFRVLREHVRDRRLAAQLVTAYAFGSVATAYASLAFGHQLSAALLFALFVAIARLDESASKADAAWIGVGASLALHAEYQNALLLVPFAVLFVLRVRARPVLLAMAALGAVPCTLGLLAYHQAAFGSPWLTGYSFLASSFKEVHAQGLLGVAWPKLSHAYLSFLSPAKGLFFFAPWLALSVPALVVALRSARTELRFVAVFIVLYGSFVSALVYPVGGWTVSQRHLVPAVPFMVVAIGVLLARARRFALAWRTLFVGLALPSVLACGGSALVWPHWQEHLENPFWQLGWPLLRAGFTAPSVSAALGISSWAFGVALLSAAALLLLACLALAASRPVWRVALPVAALALAFAFVAVARLPGASQDTTRDRRFIERVYVHDALWRPPSDGAREGLERRSGR